MTTSTKPYAVRRISSTEHQLVAGRSLVAGELILCEQPLVHVPMGRYQLGTYVWDMVDRLMADKEMLRTYVRAELLATPLFTDDQDLAIEDFMVKKYRKSRLFVRNLYWSVGTNNVGILDEKWVVRGHGVYPMLSRVDHSCAPNAKLRPANWREAEVSLVAQRDIRAGEPLTWCYFRETEFIPQDWVTRNYNLVNLYRFACRCPRCQAERPAEVPASPAKQVAYFDVMLKAEAKKLVNSPIGLEQLEAQSPMNMHRKALLESRNR